MMDLQPATERIRAYWRGLFEQQGAPARVAGEHQSEASLIERAANGAKARQFLESEPVQSFMAAIEARIVHEMTTLPLKKDNERMRLAVSIQTVRQLQHYMLASTQDGRIAERELQRLRDGDKRFF